MLVKFVFIFTIIIFSFVQISFCSVTINGSIAIHSLIFDKVITAFDHVLVKFDEAFPYGEKEDVYKEVAKVTANIPNMISASVGIADYGEMDNSDLGKRYGISKPDFPAYRLFSKDLLSPIPYKGEIKADAIKAFIVKNTGIYIGLDGCLEEFDKFARSFVATENDGQKKNILSSMKRRVNELSTDKEIRISADNYLKIASKIEENGVKFVKSEKNRLKKLADGNISDNKKIEIKRRLNILQSFDPVDSHVKLDL